MCSDESHKDDDDFDDLWPGLNISLLRDIFNTHKVFMFGSFNGVQYTINEFYSNVLKAERIIFQNPICSDRFGPSFSNFEHNATLFPSYLIHDDLFEVTRHHFAVSHWVNQLRFVDIGGGLDVFCCVIPQDVVSIYDENISKFHSYFIQDIKENFTGKSVEVIHQSKFQTVNLEVIELALHIQGCMKDIDLKQSRFIVFLIDRRGSEKTGTESHLVLRCHSLESVSDLTNNHFIGIHYDISFANDDESKEDSEKTVKCWLRYGNEQCLRFWPEQLIWFIPRLFVKRKRSAYAFLKKLYADDYKHGFCVKLKDSVFEKYYKILTTWTHQSVNYRRSRNETHSGHLQYGSLRDYIERKLKRPHLVNLISFCIDNGYSSDDILADLSIFVDENQSNIATIFGDDNEGPRELIKILNVYKKQSDAACTVENVLELWDCPFVQQLLQSLRLFENEKFVIDAGNFEDFGHETVIHGLDHLSAVHNMFSNENRGRIQNFIQRNLSCLQGEDCKALIHHCSRRREITEATDDVELDELDSLFCDVQNVLCSAHCYLLHSDETLYRLSGQSSKFEVNTFSTTVQEEEEEEIQENIISIKVPSIDFGIHVLRWLRFGELPLFPSFEEEITRNPASTLSPQMLEELRAKCIMKSRERGLNQYEPEELLCLNMYSDFTAFQNLFRRAFWKSADLATRQAFYQWAMKMYQTFLFHARPIPPKQGIPKTLFHGLNRLLSIENLSGPTYHGPFSTSMSSNVARTFSKGNGLTFSLQASYTDFLRFIVGINMCNISCFKHEQEILIYSQVLPIKGAKVYDKNIKRIVTHVLHSVSCSKVTISDAAAFYKKIGVSFNANWYPIIAVHEMLHITSKFGQSVKSRLVNELHFSEHLLHFFGDEFLIRSVGFNGAFIDFREVNTKIDLSIFEFNICVDDVDSDNSSYWMAGELHFNSIFIAPSIDRRNADSDVTLCVSHQDDESPQLPVSAATQFTFPARISFAAYDLKGSALYEIDRDFIVGCFDEGTGGGGSVEIRSDAVLTFGRDVTMETEYISGLKFVDHVVWCITKFENISSGRHRRIRASGCWGICITSIRRLSSALFP